MSMQLANLYAHHHPYIINLDDLHQMDLARSDETTMRVDEICYKCFDSIFLRLLSTLHLLRLLSTLHLLHLLLLQLALLSLFQRSCQVLKVPLLSLSFVRLFIIPPLMWLLCNR